MIQTSDFQRDTNELGWGIFRGLSRFAADAITAQDDFIKPFKKCVKIEVGFRSGNDNAVYRETLDEAVEALNSLSPDEFAVVVLADGEHRLRATVAPRSRLFGFLSNNKDGIASATIETEGGFNIVGGANTLGVLLSNIAFRANEGAEFAAKIVRPFEKHSVVILNDCEFYGATNGFGIQNDGKKVGDGYAMVSQGCFADTSSLQRGSQHLGGGVGYFVKDASFASFDNCMACARCPSEGDTGLGSHGFYLHEGCTFASVFKNCEATHFRMGYTARRGCWSSKSVAINCGQGLAIGYNQNKDRVPGAVSGFHYKPTDRTIADDNVLICRLALSNAIVAENEALTERDQLDLEPTTFGQSLLIRI